MASRPKRRRIRHEFDSDELPPDLEDRPEVLEILQLHWDAIRSWRYTTSKVMYQYNFRMVGRPLLEIKRDIEEICDGMNVAFRMNYGYGFVMYDEELDRYSYFHASPNKFTVLPQPITIPSRARFNEFVRNLPLEESDDFTNLQRPNTKTRIVLVTNLTFFIYKLDFVLIGCPGELPPFLTTSRQIIAMNKDRNGKLFRDNFCAFRCAALALDCPRSELKKKGEEMASLFSKKYRIDVSEGVKLKDLKKVEECFQVSFIVYEKEECGTVTLLRHGASVGTKVYVNLYQNHFSFIKNIESFSENFLCSKCEKMFHHNRQLREHACFSGPKEIFPGGMYKNKMTVFDDLWEFGVFIEPERRFYPYRVVFDFEAMLVKQSLPDDTPKVHWESSHVPLSVAFTSNVPGFESPAVIVSKGDPDLLVQSMIDYLSRMQDQAFSLLLHSYENEFKQMEELISERDEIDPCKKETRLDFTYKRFIQWAKQLIIIGFNSGKYDLNLIKKYLIKRLDGVNVVKRGNVFMMISTPEFRFLDISLYLAPGFSYASYLKAFQCKEQKGFFCYEYVDDYSKLAETSLPPHEKFYSHLKNENISDEEYAWCQRVWKENNMQTLSDFLKFYNICDVVPFISALEKQVKLFQTLGIDIFKDAISIPGVTSRYLFGNIEPMITVLGEKQKDIQNLIRNNLVGGPSIIIARYHAVGETKIRHRKFGDAALTVRKIVGYDANALYLWALSRKMPCWFPVVWKPGFEGIFKGVRTSPYFGYKAYRWLKWIEHERGIKIRHQFNGGEVRVGTRRIPVDGFFRDETGGTIFQFHGCRSHGHNCVVGLRNPDREAKLEKTKTVTSYLERLGFRLVVVYECEFDAMCESNESLKNFIASLDKPLSITPMSFKTILKRVCEGKFFGFIECDIHTPDHLKEKFSEMPPIFKNTFVSREDIGPFMRKFAEENGIMSQPRKLLIGSYFGQKILLSTDLIRWYIEHGLIVTKIYQCIEYIPRACFEPFAQMVSDSRRKGDRDPNCAILAQTYKLMGNASYGKTIENPSNYSHITYASGSSVSSKTNSPLFRSCVEVDDDFFEISCFPEKITWSQPVQIGFSVYCSAKLRMLQFYYDCLQKYLRENTWEFIETDTDSLYICLASDLDSCLTPELRSQFYKEYSSWFPSVACDEHQDEFIRDPTHFQKDRPCCLEKYRYSLRTPGLFKVEYEGTGFVGLCSKTYCCDNPQKLACKGLRKDSVKFSDYKQVLETGVAGGGVNRGFMSKNGGVMTYSQTRNALSYFYAKRIVLDDGVTTLPLNL